MTTVVAVFAIVMGVGIAGMWTADIVRGERVDLSAGVFKARPVAALGVGALLYTSIDSLGWVLAERDRYAYAAPMLVGLVGGLAVAVWLVAS